MNIFYLDNDPRVCAEMHNDKHCVKMIVEYAQLLSTAHRVVDGIYTVGQSKTGRKVPRYVLSDSRESNIYLASHINHPSSIWTRKTKSNYNWLYVLWRELMGEYKYRYYKTHACEKLILSLRKPPFNIPEGSFMEPPPAMPDQYKANDSIQSYRNFYNGPKASFSKWTGRSVPVWFGQ